MYRVFSIFAPMHATGGIQKKLVGVSIILPCFTLSLFLSVSGKNFVCIPHFLYAFYASFIVFIAVDEGCKLGSF
jgi:hypothetical protein